MLTRVPFCPNRWTVSRQLDSIRYAGRVLNAVRHVLVVDADPDAVSYANTSLPGMELEVRTQFVSKCSPSAEY